MPTWDERIIAANAPYSVIAENFRRLRTKILHPVEGIPPRIIMVTSAAPAEGKSFVCANLAVALAQGLEQHALLVDADLRRPSLAGIFGLANEKGLANHLQEKTDLSSLIQKTGLQKLSIIPSGPPPVNPAELLDTEKMAGMIAELSSRYPDRVVIIDSPPMLVASETFTLAQHVDGIVLVIRWGYSRRQELKKFVETIGREKIVGTVFNAFPISIIESKQNGYYQGYHNYYTSYRSTPDS